MAAEDRSDDPMKDQPLLSHLTELRNRLFKIAVAVLIVFLGYYPFADEIYTALAGPLQDVLPEGTSMIAIKVASPFLIPMKLALVASIFTTIPFLLYQVWAFVAPGLYRHEKRMVMPLVVASTLLFYAGAAFAYFVVFPLAFTFFAYATPTGVSMMTDISEYLSFVLTIFFAFGIAFQVPIATIVLVRTGATTREQLAQKRPYVIVGAFVVGMLLTPPDVISQVLLAVPVWLLYELGLLLSSRTVTPGPEDLTDTDGKRPDG